MTTPDHTDEETAVHRRITDRLRQLTSTGTGSAHPYLRRHLVEHARRGQVLDDAHIPSGFLRWENNGQIRGALGLPIVDDPRHAVLAAWARVEPFLGDADVRSRALSLRFARLASGAASPEDTASPSHPGEILGLQPRWAHWSLPGNVLAYLGSPVVAVCAVPGPGGRTLLATGSRDETVRLWDPATGTPVGEPLTGHTDRVEAVCAVPGPGGRTLLATGSGDETVRLWDPVTGTPVGEPLTGHTDRVEAVCAVPGSGGRTLLATGGRDGTVRLWDPATGTPVGEPLVDRHAV